MPLVPCKCTNCGANLQVDNTKDAAVCEYCGSAFIVEKAINNYNVTNHITAGVVNVYGGNSTDFVIRGGVLEKYTGSAIDVVIPNNVILIKGGIEGRGGAFQGCVGVRSVTIPDSVTKIGDSAFSGCTGLTSVTIPNSVTEIGLSAFSGCTSLTSISIPYGTTRLCCFSGCTSLKDITIPKSVTRLGGFSGCTALTNITIPNSVTEIEAHAFSGCKGLSEIIIPPSVNKIGYWAFGGCSGLKKVSLPDTIQEIGRFVDGYSEYRDITYSLERKDVTRFKNSLTWYAGKKIGIFNVFGTDNDYIKETLFAWNDRNLKLTIKEESKRGWCYIATAVYGSYDCPPVWTLRRFRDHTLAATRQGRAFIRVYYAVSPTLVKWFGNATWFRMFWKRKLDKLVARLQDQGVKDTPYQDKDL